MRDHKGSVLIALIVTIVTLAVLGAAMVSLTSTSLFSQVGANSSTRAYFLAESGYRYTESRYLNASDQDSELEAVHNQSTYTLSNDEGQFKLNIYPYYFKIIEKPAIGTFTLKTKIPGGFPPGVTIGQPGWLKIGPKSNSIHRYQVASVAGANVTFTMREAIPSYFPVGSDVLYVAESEIGQTVTKGGDFLAHDRTSGLPLRYGTLLINNHLYRYKENDIANRTLKGIEDPADPNMPDISVADKEMIVLPKFVKLHSTGTFGLGSVEGLANREVVYHVPLPVTEEQRKEFVDTFEDKSNWEPDTLGTTAIEDIGGNALRVTATGSLGGEVIGSLVGLKWSQTDLDLAAAHAYGNPYFLSYDAQVKVGFDPTVPEYYAAGLSFRLDNDNNSYGLSFLRGDDSADPLDNLDDEIVPDDEYGKQLIVLWQGTNSGNTRKWLAYKKDLALFFKDDMEAGVNGWTATGLWDQSTALVNSPIKSWYYGIEGFLNYNTGIANSGTLESPSIDLSLATSATLTFWSWYHTESHFSYPGCDEGVDMKAIDISTNGGTTWNNLKYIRDPEYLALVPYQISLPLSGYVGQMVKIRFRFDTCDAFSNDFIGWFIDDVRISGDTAAAIQEATLVVRVKEAASVTFTNGTYGSGTTPIENLDTVVGQTSGSRGVVTGAPIISSGSWASSNAAGTLMLKNTIGAFSVGEEIKVIGSDAAATVSGYRSRDNFIRAYYGNTSGYGTSDSNALNDEKKANPRGSVNWPPDELADWSADNDYFTLIQWDVIRSDLGENVVEIDSIDEPNAVIRSNTLASPTSDPLVQPELGLHTFGKGSTNVYFDDFAVQADVGSSSNTGFVRTIQE